LLIFGSTLAAAQATSPETPVSTLSVAGDVRTLSITPTELKAMPRTTLEVKDENGRAVKYEGVLVGELLKRAGRHSGARCAGTP